MLKLMFGNNRSELFEDLTIHSRRLDDNLLHERGDRDPFNMNIDKYKIFKNYFAKSDNYNIDFILEK